MYLGFTTLANTSKLANAKSPEFICPLFRAPHIQETCKDVEERVICVLTKIDDSESGFYRTAWAIKGFIKAGFSSVCFG